MLAGPQSTDLNSLRFMTADQAADLVREYGTPLFVYSESVLVEQAQAALAFPAPHGLTVRYAMKANPLAAILQVFGREGLSIDASSENEVHRAVKAGIEPRKIMLTSQQFPRDLKGLMRLGITYNATSLHQLESFGQAFPGGEVSVRFNVGLGSGHTRSVSVAGPTSSFGIWHEQAPAVRELLERYRLSLTTIHSHIGCGNEPHVYTQAARKTLELVEQFPTVTRLNLGGGFKVARMPHEHATDLQALGNDVSRQLTEFARRTSRQLHLEIEPGTLLTANAGTLLTTIQDITSTGPDGYNFLKLDTGMNDILRPALHASQHPIIVLGRSQGTQDYVVVGHNCESTDLLTPSPSDSETPLPRTLASASIGDTVAIEGVGAYCSSLRAIGYNSFSSPNEVLITATGQPKLINRSLGIEQYTASEIYD